MDSRRPYSRPQPQSRPPLEDPRFHPIPPPPYSSQRPDLLSHNDPFFPRRPHFDSNAASPTKQELVTSYGLPPPPYPLNPFATPPNNTNDGRLRRGSHEANLLYEQRRREEQQGRNGEGTSEHLFFVLGWPFLVCLIRPRRYHDNPDLLSSRYRPTFLRLVLPGPLFARYFRHLPGSLDSISELGDMAEVS